MRLWQLQVVIVAAIALLGWGLTMLPQLQLPASTATACDSAGSAMDRQICAELGRELSVE